jgi:hypothetical protein
MKRFSELKRWRDINGNKLNHYDPFLKVISVTVSKLLKSEKCLRENEKIALFDPQFNIVVQLI